MLFLSTVYTGNEYEPRIRRRPTTTQPRARPILQIFSDKPVKTLEIPSIAAEYNDNMNAVDNVVHGENYYLHGKESLFAR